MKALKRHITDPVSIAPLAVFRVLFGFIMVVSTLRFVLKGWVRELYLRPDFFFSYYGFEWVEPLGAVGMYGLFVVMGAAALCIMVGWHYRLAAIAFFLSFTYVELIDQTHYLNHYYFVSLVSFLLIWVPAHRRFSLDVRRKPELRRHRVPAWTVNIFKLQLGLVYFFAGAAKLNPDWLLNAMPMKIWLAAHAHWPVVGSLLDESLTAYLFSWAGAIYDLTIAFFLLYRPTRIPAYVAVVGFHLVTYALFQIGMFPFIMILCTLIFFSPQFHERVLEGFHFAGWWLRTQLRSLSGLLHLLEDGSSQVNEWRRNAPGSSSTGSDHTGKTHPHPFSEGSAVKRGVGSQLVAGILISYFLLQLLLPLRFLLYPGNVLWTEQGFRFSWRVMLVEKAGHAVFHVRNPDTGRSWEAANWRYLTPRQEKMMAMKPDMILQYAHYLEEVYKKRGRGDVEITVESRVTLNGRRSRPLIDPSVDLTEVNRGWANKPWILPMNNRNQTWFGELTE